MDEQREVNWRLLGPDTVETVEGPVVTAARPRSVLLALLAHRGAVVSTDRLARALWGDTPPKTAANSIARFVADLRRALGDHAGRVVTVADGYRLEVSDGEVDVDRARSALAAAEAATATGELTQAAELAARGLAEFTGEAPAALVDLDDGVAVVRAHEELELRLWETWADLLLRLGHHLDLAEGLEQAVGRHPHHERLWAQLMLALYGAGRQADALAAYQRLAGNLADLGLVPTPALRRLEAQILSHADPASLHVAPDARPPGRSGHYALAEPRTSFVGRRHELADLDRLMAGARLVTVAGLGGSGKTRLAQEWARAEEARGVPVYRIGLRPVTDPDLVLAVVAEALGVPPGSSSSTPEALAHHLRRDRFLVLLDNCEHLVGACGAIIEALLDKVAGCRVLATSRRRLGVRDEATLRLGPLDAPHPGAIDPESPAVALFVDRARAHAPELVFDGDALVEIGAICRAVAGLPVAVELAAAHSAYLSPADLLDQLSESTGPGAHEEWSLRARLAGVIDWAWQALSPTEQVLLARLSVFGDTWTMSAAEAVGGGDGVRVPEDLLQLVDKNVVSVVSTAGATRYGMLDVVRRRAAAQLEERGEVVASRDRLVDWLSALAGSWGIAELQAWADAMDVLEPELANLVAGLDHLRSCGRREEMCWLAVRFGGVLTQRGYAGEAARWLAPLVEAVALPDEARSAAAAVLMDAYSSLGEPESVVSSGVRSLELAAGRPHDWVPHVAGVLGMLSLAFVVPETADEYHATAIAAAKASPSRSTNLAVAELWRGTHEFGLREYEAAVSRFRVARAHCQERGRILLLCEVGVGLALYLMARADPGRGAEAVRLAADWRSRGDTDEWHHLVDVARAIIDGGGGDPVEATARLAAAVRALEPGGVWFRADDYQLAFGVLADQRGESELAGRLLAGVLPGTPILLTLLIEHVAVRSGRDGPMGWRLTAMEVIAAAHLGEDDRETVRSLPELVSWWANGDVSEGLTDTTSSLG